MKNLYEVRVAKADYYTGLIVGYETIGYTIDRAKAQEVADAWTEAHDVAIWWHTYYVTEERKILVEIVDRGTIIE